MKNFFLVLSHYNFIQIKVKTKKSMTLQPFNIRGWKWLSAYESFNAKIKKLRANFRGVADVKFFLFRVAKLFA